jgi:hypothetical protein
MKPGPFNGPIGGMLGKTMPASVSECAAAANSWMPAVHGSPQAWVVALSGREEAAKPAIPAKSYETI